MKRNNTRGALSNIIWAIIGILASVTLGAIIYTLMSSGISTSTQLAVNGYLISNNKMIIDIRNIGTGEVTIRSIELYTSSGNRVSTCNINSVVLNGGTVHLPATLRPGQTLSIYLSGSNCFDAYVIIVHTNYGIYRGYVSS